MDTIDAEAEKLTADPVCGKEMAAGMDLFDTEYGGKVTTCCSEHGRLLVALHPETYVAEPAGDAPR